MLKKFALTDDGSIKLLPIGTPDDDVMAAAKALGEDVLFTLDKDALKDLRKNIDEVLGEAEGNEALAQMKTLPLAKAMWWFIENVSVDSPAYTQCFFELRRRHVNKGR